MHRAMLAVGLAAAMTLPISVAGAATGATTAAPGVPNLVGDGQRVQSSVVFKTQMFTSKDCAYVENSLTGTGKRTLMRFDVSAANRGAGPVVLGNPVNNPLFEWSPCHRHYHFSGYALYELFRSDPRAVSTAALVTGRKQAF